MSTIVTIGRNVPEQGNLPMSGERWERFISDTTAIVLLTCGTVYFVGTGQGVYEGQTEQSWTIIADAPVSLEEHDSLKWNLAELAHTYLQECIALTVGETVFCG